MKRILVVDDEDQIRSLLGKMLRYEGYEVIEVADGKEAVKRFREEPADLVITDIFMPEKDGLEIIRELRREHPGVKFITISGGGQFFKPTDFQSSASKFGAMRHVSKPFRQKDILEAVESLFVEEQVP